MTQRRPRSRRSAAQCSALELAGELVGFPRHLSQHVGGFVITRTRLDEVVPIENAAMEDRTVVEWDKDDLDALGILKVDVLGARHADGAAQGLRPARAALRRASSTLATMPPEEAVRLRDDPARRHDRRVPDREPRADVDAAAAEAEKFYDLVIEVAIVRPGPIQGDMVHPYLRARGRGKEPVVVSVRRNSKDVLWTRRSACRCFRSRRCSIAIVAAGFTPAEADKLRRAMATFKRVGTIEHASGQVDRRHGGQRLSTREFAERCFQPDRGLRRIWLSRKPRGELRPLVYVSAG